MFIHPRVFEQEHFRMMKEVVLNDFNLSLYEKMKVIQCKYRTQLYTIIRKLNYSQVKHAVNGK
jgi:hypothetical protein